VVLPLLHADVHYLSHGLELRHCPKDGIGDEKRVALGPREQQTYCPMVCLTAGRKSATKPLAREEIKTKLEMRTEAVLPSNRIRSAAFAPK